MNVAGFKFDECDGPSIVAHARRLENLTVGEIIAKLGRSSAPMTVGKGRIGQLLQTWFGVGELDSRKAPDLPLARFPGSDKVGLEIKVVPMRKSGGVTDLRTKERNVVSNINYRTLPFETWSTASVRAKLEHVLLIFYRYDAFNLLAAKVLHTHHWCFADEPQRERIALDWAHVHSVVAEGRAHELSERDPNTQILRTCRRGRGGPSEHKIPQYSSLIPAWKRAFALKPGHLDLIWIRDVQSQPIASLSKPRVDVDSSSKSEEGGPAASPATRLAAALLSRLEGKRLRDLDPHRDWKKVNKSAAALVLNRALGRKFVNRKVVEFVEEQLILRVLQVHQTTLQPLEAVSFPAMNLVDFANEDWQESELRSYLNLILFIPTLVARRRMNQGDRVIGRSFFWSPSADEESGIFHEWADFQSQVRSGLCKTHEDSYGRNVSMLKKASETRYIHMRPHGRDGKDMDVDPAGNRIVQQCFWLNRAFIHQLIVRSRTSPGAD